MSAASLFHHPLILRTIFGGAFMMACSGLMSCGRSDMKESEHRHSAKEAVKEPNKIMMIQSDDPRYKRCFSFPSEVGPIQVLPSGLIFHFKNFGYISGTEKSPGIIGNPGTSMVSVSIFRDISSKKYYIHSLSRAYRNGQVKIEGEYKAFYLYDLKDFTYSAINKDGLFTIEYDIGDGRPRSKEEWIHELKLIVDFVESHTIPCQGAS
ncbi:hypothetical protein FUT69_09260 [Xylella taiwanensis]|uniref:Uncharacterized protein n=1 Tax=Xylella taiwanensis TaxID=1444770 RepID=Z9JM27_9GAMM|nr:hypothetical protein [Xylella taiwanensis]EWS79219.1 hypothetical protein AF72_01950 [Xylella taiwanensis]MCD8456309.1 hypothetical protein [Xylella taiwanensis]MCD8458717.1 hypothetical protein [Xylella taiwanensis]MCD8460852.1 hypothetical protein [Xylella taiwanensis]MCD8463089.1 hypothetical protein [Xylella taiwanensis]